MAKMMNKVKNIFKSKVTLAIIACLLLVGVFAGLTMISSGDGDPILTIESKNINHADSARLNYRVFIANVSEETVLANKDTLEMNFWTTEPASPDANPEYVTKGTVEGAENGGVWVVFESFAIAPKAMTNSIYCSAEYNGKYSDVDRYSVFQYLCEMTLKGASHEQQALYDAMEDYIHYAQLYLGVQGTNFPSPDTLGYVKLTNCWIEINGEQIFDGVVPIDDYELHSNYALMKVVDSKGYIGDVREGTWYANLTAQNELSYTAHEATLLNVTVPENVDLVLVNTSTVDGEPAYTVREAYTTGDHTLYVLTDDSYYWVPAGVEGKVFSGWQLGDNTELVSTEVMYAFSSETLPTPVFKTDDEFGASTDRINNLDKWYNEFSQSKDTSITNSNMSYEATSNGISGAFSRMYWSMDIKLSSMVTSDYDNLKVSDFFKYYNNQTTVNFYDHLQYAMTLGNPVSGTTSWSGGTTNTAVGFGLANTTDVAKTLDKSLDNTYYLSLRKSFGNSSSNALDLNQDNGRALMSYGLYNNIQLLLDATTNDDGTITISRISAFINGNFVGSAGIKCVDSIDYSNDTMSCKMMYVGRVNNTSTFIKNFMVKKFN